MLAQRRLAAGDDVLDGERHGCRLEQSQDDAAVDRTARARHRRKEGDPVGPASRALPHLHLRDHLTSPLSWTTVEG